MEAETTGIIISTAVATKVLDVALAWVKAKFAKNPQPFITEQSSYQAAMKANAKDHENLFLRMSSVEKDVAGIKADNAAQNRLLDRMVNRIDALYDRIILGGKKK